MQSFCFSRDNTCGDTMFPMEAARLIELCRQGDTEALGELYKIYAQRMRGVCRRYIGDDAEADDVLHDAFVIIFTSFDKLRDERLAEAWMRGIVRNVALKYRSRRDALPMVPLDDELVAAETDDTVHDVRGASLQEVTNLIDQLPAGYGQVFRLSVFEGLSHREIAHRLGIAPHSSSSQLARAKKMLRKMMRRYWAIVLLLLLPLALLWFDADPPAPKKGGLTTEKKKETLTTDTPAVKIVVPAEPPSHDSSRQHLAHAPQPEVVTDEALPVSKKEETAETVVIVPADSTKDTAHETTPRRHLTDLFRPRQMQSRESKGRWSVKLAYAAQYGAHGSSDRPFAFTYSNVIAPSHEGTSHLVPLKIDTWTDFVLYVDANPAEFSPQTRGIIKRIALNNANVPGSDKIRRRSHHRMPVAWSVAVRYQMNRRWGLETGLGYSKLTSDFQVGQSGDEIASRQTIHYLSLPLKTSFDLLTRRRWNLYGCGGLTMEIPAAASLVTSYSVQGSLQTTERERFRAPWQFSGIVGAGLQFRLTPSFGLFAEPDLQYYFPTHTTTETYRTEHPLVPSLSAGIRFTW